MSLEEVKRLETLYHIKYEALQLSVKEKYVTLLLTPIERQLALSEMGPNKPHISEIGFITPFTVNYSQPCIYYLFWTQMIPMTLKYVYKVKNICQNDPYYDFKTFL